MAASLAVASLKTGINSFYIIDADIYMLSGKEPTAPEPVKVNT
jgi:hypothetical protein